MKTHTNSTVKLRPKAALEFLFWLPWVDFHVIGGFQKNVQNHWQLLEAFCHKLFEEGYLND
jgi:hypothetical protein